jgi:sucrose phosphorylase
LLTTDRILPLLEFLYGEEAAPGVFESLLERVKPYADLHGTTHSAARGGISERDAILITYGDQVTSNGQPPLQTLASFLRTHVSGLVTGVHLLPFYPYSSDDGFSVIDYREVDRRFGDWANIREFQADFRLMFDAVINHISQHSSWFQGFLRCEEPCADYFICVEADADLSQVVRPRALPLLTRFETACGPRYVWTTFSDDQIDLNYQNPSVLLEIIDLLLFYASHGAEFIRLDAIAYLWKDLSTPCIHLAETHAVIKLFRAVLDDITPGTILITETNVPHIDNISYFGNGNDEAQMVYNFALPPLVLHAFHTGQAQVLSAWAKDLSQSTLKGIFFNFLASHDGIGLNPLRGILPEKEILTLTGRIQSAGGLVSYKHNPDGTQSPYELNVSYFDALANPAASEPLELQIDRFMGAHAIMLALAGVPGIYFHSLFGSVGWPDGVKQSGQNRTINRQKLALSNLESELSSPSSRRARVFRRFTQLLTARQNSSAFHPYGAQSVLDLDEAVFSLLRTSPDGREQVLCLSNVSSSSRLVEIARSGLPAEASGQWVDLISSEAFDRLGSGEISLRPYQTIWLGRRQG